MPDIDLLHIVSCSSEDSHFPAKNLLQGNRKWRTAKDGDSSATVVIQLQKETKISKVDIGNNGSAFVEVLVGKSSAPHKEFDVLLLNSSFMTPSESRAETDTTRVRMFDLDKLCKDTANQKWDQIKIVCQQKFNLHVQFGLSFIKLQAPAESSPGTIGRFALRDEQEDVFGPGSLFARRKLAPTLDTKPKTAAAAIANATGSPYMPGKTKAAVILPKKRENGQNGNTPEAKRRLIDSPSGPSPGTSDRKPGKYRKVMEGHSDEEEERAAEEKAKEKAAAEEKEVKRKAKAAEKEEKKKKTEVVKKPTEPSPGLKRAKKKLPFNQLLKGVTFVLSGLQNPARAVVRDNALDMGAKYKADWDKNCTHLVCAFGNTPKIRQVKAMGSGKIVSKDWIDQCFRKRIRFPWRRFAVEKADQDESESEEEILEDTSAAAAGPSRVVDVEEEESDIIIALDDDDDDDVQKSQVIEEKTEKLTEQDVYNLDTDEDSDGAEVSKWPKLPEFFDGLSFTLHEELPKDLKAKLRRYIITSKGKVVDDLNEDVKFLVTESKEGLTELKEFYPDVRAVNPQWVWESYDNNKLAPLEKFLVK